ncbi:MAG: branched-chain amino acid ABC transporter permease [Alphaproteobacteria bacterium]|nr:branched-chain amino acid ABC transporter permease [Alphaproteobacteria bacterium]
MLLQLLINTLIVGSGYGLIAMAFRLMYSVSPFFNLTLGSVVAVSAYAALYFTPSLRAGAIFPVVAIAALLSWALEAFAYKPMRDRRASPMILLVASLGLYTIFESVISLAFGVKYHALGDGAQIYLGFTTMPLVQFLIIIFNFAVFAGLSVFLHHSFMGKQIRAVNDEAALAHMIGMKTDRIIMIVSVITGAILGLSGVLIGYDTGMEPTMGFNLLFKGIIAAIIGGMRNLRGAFFGALFLAFSENVAVWAFASEWRDLVAFAIFITFLYLRPQGIFQKKVEA